MKKCPIKTHVHPINKRNLPTLLFCLHDYSVTLEYALGILIRHVWSKFTELLAYCKLFGIGKALGTNKIWNIRCLFMLNPWLETLKVWWRNC